jgi:putative thioredoxin
MSTYTKDVNTADFTREVIDRSYEVPVVVDFWAAWCGPCRVLGPLLEQAAQERAGAFELAKVDVDQNQALAAQFGVQGIPMVIGFRDGKAVSYFTGAIPRPQLEAWLSELIPSEEDREVDRARDLLLAGEVAGAERIYREVLAADPGHQQAGTGLAALLIGADRPDQALEVLDRLSPTEEVRRLQAAARIGVNDESDIPSMLAELDVNPDDHELRIRLARALAAAGRHEDALDHLMHVVRESPEHREEARLAMLDIFQVLGHDHSLTTSYRRELANTLF